jgi:hypothetical protein
MYFRSLGGGTHGFVKGLVMLAQSWRERGGAHWPSGRHRKAHLKRRSYCPPCQCSITRCLGVTCDRQNRAATCGIPLDAGVHACLTLAIAGKLTPSAGSVPKFVAQKPDSVKIRSKFTADRNSFPRIDHIDEVQGARADHWPLASNAAAKPTGKPPSPPSPLPPHSSPPHHW